MKSKACSDSKGPVLLIGILLVLLAVIGFEGLVRKDGRMPQRVVLRQQQDTLRSERGRPAMAGRLARN